VDGEDLLVITGTESTTLSRPIPWNLIMICTSWAVSFSSSDRLSPDDLLDAMVLHPLSQACDQLRSEVQHVHLAAATQSLRCGVFHISNFDLEAVNAVRQLVDREPCLNRRTQEKPGSVVIVLFFDHGARKSLQEAIPRLRDGLLDGIDGRKERLWKFYPSLSFEGKHSRKPDGEPFTILCTDFHSYKIIQLAQRSDAQVRIHTRNFDLDAVARFVRYMHTTCLPIFHHNTTLVMTLHLDSDADASMERWIRKLHFARQPRDFGPFYGLPYKFGPMRYTGPACIVWMALTPLYGKGVALMSPGEIDRLVLKMEATKKLEGRVRGLKVVTDVSWVTRVELKYAQSLIRKGVRQQELCG